MSAAARGPIFDTDDDGATCAQATQAAIGVLGLVDSMVAGKNRAAAEIATTMTFSYGMSGAVSVMRTMLHGCPVRDRVLDLALIVAGARLDDNDALRLVADITQGLREDAEEFPLHEFEPTPKAVTTAAWLSHMVITISARELAVDVDPLRMDLRRYFLRHLAERHTGDAS